MTFHDGLFTFGFFEMQKQLDVKEPMTIQTRGRVGFIIWIGPHTCLIGARLFHFHKKKRDKFMQTSTPNQVKILITSFLSF